MDTIPCEEAKEKLSELISKANEQKRQFRIDSNEGSVVVLPQETYDNILVTLEVLSTPGLIERFSTVEEDEMFQKIEQMPRVSNQ